MFRALARRCKIDPRTARQLTLRQAINLIGPLDDDGGDGDPHAGNMPFMGIDQLQEWYESEVG